MHIYIHRSSTRFAQHWSAFLNKPDAELDPQYSNIKHIYDTVMSKGSNIKQDIVTKSSKRKGYKNSNNIKRKKVRKDAAGDVGPRWDRKH